MKNAYPTKVSVGTMVFSALLILSVSPVQAETSEQKVRNDGQISQSSSMRENVSATDVENRNIKNYRGPETRADVSSNSSLDTTDKYTFNDKDRFVDEVEAQLETIDDNVKMLNNTIQQNRLKDEMASIKEDIKDKLEAIRTLEKSEFETAKREIQQDLRRLRSVQEKSSMQ